MPRYWELAPSIKILVGEVNYVWPKRSKKSDGGLGDTAHSKRKSDHNINGRGRVNAYDFTNDGIDVGRLVAKAIADPRCNYVISKGLIWAKSNGYVPRTYLGTNPHDKHVHVSIFQTSAAETSTASWNIARSGSSAGGGASKPGLPSTGNPPQSQPKGDTLSASEADRVIAELKTYIQDRHSASNELLGGRTKLNQIGATSSDYVASKGFSRAIYEIMGEAAGRHAAAAVDAKLNALAKMHDQLLATGKLTEAQVKTMEKNAHNIAFEGAKQGSEAGIVAGVKQVTETWNEALREVLTELLSDNGRASNAEIVELAMAEVAKRVAPQG